MRLGARLTLLPVLIVLLWYLTLLYDPPPLVYHTQVQTPREHKKCHIHHNIAITVHSCARSRPYHWPKDHENLFSEGNGFTLNPPPCPFQEKSRNNQTQCKCPKVSGTSRRKQISKFGGGSGWYIVLVGHCFDRTCEFCTWQKRIYVLNIIYTEKHWCHGINYCSCGNNHLLRENNVYFA